MLSSSQSSQKAFSPPTVVGSIAGAPSAEVSGNQASKLANPELALHDTLNQMIVDLVSFLFIKYRRKQWATRAQMLDRVMRDYENYYPMIFRKAYECMRWVFNIDMIQVDPFV